jgi:hypothetical protein
MAGAKQAAWRNAFHSATDYESKSIALGWALATVVVCGRQQVPSPRGREQSKNIREHWLWALATVAVSKGRSSKVRVCCGDQ